MLCLYVKLLSLIDASVNKGELSVTLRQVLSLAPFAQVVVYTVMPSGEAVADTHDYSVQLCFNNKVDVHPTLQRHVKKS